VSLYEPRYIFKVNDIGYCKTATNNIYKYYSILKESYDYNTFHNIELSSDTYEIIVEINPSTFANVPLKMRTQRMCDLAMSYDLYSMKYVPEKFIKSEYITNIIEKEPIHIQHIPSKFLTQELCTQAFNNNSDSFKFIPDQFKTIEMCRTALRKTINVLTYIPNELIDADMIHIAYGDVLISPVKNATLKVQTTMDLDTVKLDLGECQ
jgi:hypothetical protein